MKYGREFFRLLDWLHQSTDNSVYSLYKMRETFLVEIFCDVNLDEYDRAIGESFSKLAFEAVERIINVSQTLPLGYW